jgi:hypothetical protein
LVNLYLDLARVRPIEKKSHPASDERSLLREQWVSNASLRALDWKPEETLRQATSDQLDPDWKRA